MKLFKNYDSDELQRPGLPDSEIDPTVLYYIELEKLRSQKVSQFKYFLLPICYDLCADKEEDPEEERRKELEAKASYEYLDISSI